MDFDEEAHKLFEKLEQSRKENAELEKLEKNPSAGIIPIKSSPLA